jgi:hypothetical protein
MALEHLDEDVIVVPKFCKCTLLKGMLVIGWPNYRDVSFQFKL